LAADAEDRKGISEIRHVTGILSLYDELQRRHPNLLIDNCCAGGRRNDIETLRRSVPLWRSDFWTSPVPMQCQTYGLAQWIPFYGHAAGPADPYVFRSNIHPSGVMLLDMRKPSQDFSLLKRLIAEYRRIAPNLLGDYYPLTPYSQANDAWMAWQFDRPEQGKGVVQAFRRTEANDESLRVKLHGLEPNAVYALTYLDADGSTDMTGRQLVEGGLTMTIKDRPGAAIVVYEKRP
jgi:alpha-galactosidase